MAEFTLEQAMRAQATLRVAAGKPEERFPTEQLIGMLSDEIRDLRERGSSDESIAELLQSQAGLELDAATIEKYYVDTSIYKHGDQTDEHHGT